MSVVVINPLEPNKSIPVVHPYFWKGSVAFAGVVPCFYVRDVLLQLRIWQNNSRTQDKLLFDFWNMQDFGRSRSVLIGSKSSQEYTLSNGYWMRPNEKKVYSVVSTAVVTAICPNYVETQGKKEYNKIKDFYRNDISRSIIKYGCALRLYYIYSNCICYDSFIGINTFPRDFQDRFGYLYYTNPYGAFEFFPAFCIAKKFRDKKGGRRPELFEVENTDTKEVVWELGIPMESLQRSLSVTQKEKNPSVLFQYFNEMLRSYVIYFAPPGHTDIEESITHWHRVAITSKNVQPDIHKTYVKVEVTAITEVLCPTIKPNAYDE